MVDGDQVERLFLGEVDALRAIFCRDHGVTAPAQQFLDQPPRPGVVIDVQDTPRGLHQSALLGTWITDRKRPNWRIASAKLS